VNLLGVQDLKVHFPVNHGLLSAVRAYLKAVDGVSFALASGETLGLVGESGCGKTTLGRAIVRLIEPTGGRILFEGEDLARLNGAQLRARRRQFQMIFQDPYSSLDPRLTVGDSIGEALDVRRLLDRTAEFRQRHAAWWRAIDEMLWLYPFGVPKRGLTLREIMDEAREIWRLMDTRAARKQRIAELLEAVGLEPAHAQRYPHEFSGGQRQRIGIARALAVEPRLLVCDEPVSALDVSVQAQIVNLLQDLQARRGLAYLFIAHDLAVVEHLSHRVAVMYLGRIVELGEARTIIARPKHPYTQALISAVPVVDPVTQRQRIVLPGDIPSPIEPPPGCPFHPRCRWAEERCRSIAPAWREVTPTHGVACHLAR